MRFSDVCKELSLGESRVISATFFQSHFAVAICMVATWEPLRIVPQRIISTMV